MSLCLAETKEDTKCWLTIATFYLCLSIQWCLALTLERWSTAGGCCQVLISLWVQPSNTFATRASLYLETACSPASTEAPRAPSGTRSCLDACVCMSVSQACISTPETPLNHDATTFHLHLKASSPPSEYYVSTTNVTASVCFRQSACLII